MKFVMRYGCGNTLLTVCNRQPGREQEALKMIEAHFNINYSEDKQC